MHIAASSDIGRVRSQNEDTYAAIDLQPAALGQLVVVADGMGGYEAGEIASALAVAEFIDYVRSRLAGFAEAIETLLAHAIEHAHKVVLAEATRRNVNRMGSTLTAALFNNDDLYWGHIGDSRLYQVRVGVITQLSEDHSVVGELIRQGNLTETEAMVHPKRNLLTHAVGMAGELRIDIGQCKVKQGDVYVLCSDGLTNLVSSDEIANIVAANSSDVASEQLIALANERGGDDNITVAVVAP